MLKKGCLSGLALVMGLVLFLGCFGLALADEVLTITTYYPSPYGSYNELQSNKLAIGDTNGSGDFDVGDQPRENGSLRVARSVILEPVTPSSLPNPAEGELAYDASADKLSLYNGSDWVAQSSGGGGGVVTLIGGDSSAPACPVSNGWVEALYGYWNCSGNITSCFCGVNFRYTFYDSESGGLTGVTNSRTQFSGGGFYRCRICVK